MNFVEIRDQLWQKQSYVSKWRDLVDDSAELGASAADEQQDRYDEDAWHRSFKIGSKVVRHVSMEEILRCCMKKLPRDWIKAIRTGWLDALRRSMERKRASKNEHGATWGYCPVPL